jgi:hypothetical protein
MVPVVTLEIGGREILSEFLGGCDVCYCTRSGSRCIAASPHDSRRDRLTRNSLRGTTVGGTGEAQAPHDRRPHSCNGRRRQNISALWREGFAAIHA